MTITTDTRTAIADVHAAKWAAALTESIDAALALYADEFVFDDTADDDHVTDTAITKDELRPKLAPFSNKDRANGSGIHRFEIREAFDLTGDDGLPAAAILWTWTGKDLETYHGLPVGGRTLSTIGLTWQQLDADGRITRESTYWVDTPLLGELGVPVQTVHYWKEGFGA
ncbi:ketosteroid isomerase-related protein [Arthrobacter sp. AZCC_0090]|uniref:ketosteroid isomerase-related protein n=1 Tax=Arthrobacter sp. AZCC_0090 TaxID=2735881 RepID=UPI0016143A2E|nr:ketosteroid isomerase-related protein [Arthrobacter sp. AZCC_0090]MBB6407087.1 steroid delta-isomerase-like uncharacterized protein [Arthrobacter sp. AZCC_0090]